MAIPLFSKAFVTKFKNNRSDQLKHNAETFVDGEKCACDIENVEMFGKCIGTGIRLTSIEIRFERDVNEPLLDENFSDNRIECDL